MLFRQHLLMMWGLTALFLVVLSTSYGEVTKYDGYKVYKTFPLNEEHAALLKNLQDNVDVLDFWSELRSLEEPVDIMVPPEYQNEFVQFLQSNNIPFNAMVDDVQRLIDEEEIQQAEAKKQRSSSSRIQFNQYYRFDEINPYLEQLAADYPNLVTLEYIGDSLLGRPQLFAKVSTNPSAGEPIVLIDGGIHAREWIAPATVLYIINQLVENATNRYLLEDVDWYILPVLNPDGYEFSHASTRLWRKTRSPGILCTGTDGNRNFDFFWGTVGASALECSETYRGPSANSEVETRNLIAFATKYASRIKLYLSYHSYGNYFLYPWGYVNSAAPNGAELQALGNAAAAAIQAYSGTRYTVGPSSTTLYATSGSSVDWVYGVLNVTLSYTVELPGNGFGFQLPPAQILPVVLETWESVIVFGRYVADNYAKK